MKSEKGKSQRAAWQSQNGAKLACLKVSHDVGFVARSYDVCITNSISDAQCPNNPKLLTIENTAITATRVGKFVRALGHWDMGHLNADFGLRILEWASVLSVVNAAWHHFNVENAECSGPNPEAEMLLKANKYGVETQLERFHGLYGQKLLHKSGTLAIWS